MGMMLEMIRADRERALAETMNQRPEGEVRRAVEALLAKRSRPSRFVGALRQPGGPHLIAELKKASPSAGVIRSDYDVARIAAGYARAGARALSVLTEPTWFQGSLEHLRLVRAAVDLPLLRKDFLFHRYQLLEAVECGADAVLLIVAMLGADELVSLHGDAADLGLDCLVEVHTADELRRALDMGARLLGINNRDLQTMRVDLETTFRLMHSVPKGIAVVSESGIRCRADVKRLGEAGVNAVLVGEALMRRPDPARAAAALLRDEE